MEKRCSTRGRHRRQRRFAVLTSLCEENQTDSTVQVPAASRAAGPWQGDLLILRKKDFGFHIWPSYGKESLRLEASRNTTPEWKHCLLCLVVHVLSFPVLGSFQGILPVPGSVASFLVYLTKPEEIRSTQPFCVLSPAGPPANSPGQCPSPPPAAEVVPRASPSRASPASGLA